MGMEMVCFDLEGVFVPEVWINVARATGITELELTTRDIADYDELMAHRLRVLDQHNLGIAEIQDVIAGIKPLPGAVEFLAWARTQFQTVILSDTFYDFAAPLMAQLDYPVLFCHNLEISEGRIVDYHLRLPNQKRQAVAAFRNLNFAVFAVGDSYNDTAMLLEADHGFLFNPPPKVVAEFPQLPVVNDYDQLKSALIGVSSRDIG